MRALCIALALLGTGHVKAPKAPKAPSRQDALKFDSGAILISDPGGAGRSLDKGSPWHLTDGDEEIGWRSEESKPLGGTFVWDLDSVWNLDTFTMSNKSADEAEYPGCSVKTVEILVSNGDAFHSLGTLEVGTQEKTEVPLPKGTQARQVKLVVMANHGSKDFTEISEVGIFGTRTMPIMPVELAGDYTTNNGPMHFVQAGTDVYGCYDYAGDTSQVWGSVSGRVARVVWQEPHADTYREGTATFAVGPDKNLYGVWYMKGWLSGEWRGPHVPPNEAPKCAVSMESAIEQSLKRTGRAVLYGIHFDTDSDIPLADSAKTLNELAQAMKTDQSLRLLVEGHTDAQNTEQYNMDLSQRRASSVVALLVQRGVQSRRLQAKGFGRTRPVADNATSQGRALNRRVEVSIIK